MLSKHPQFQRKHPEIRKLTDPHKKATLSNQDTSMEMNPSPASSSQMATAGKIMRKSVHTFLQQYQFFTSMAAVLAFPFALSVLLSQALIPRSLPLLPTIHGRIGSLFRAAGFPPQSDFFALVNLKLSQTISTSIVTLPFALSFLLMAKASVIKALNRDQKSPFPLISLYNPLLLTQILNYLLILAANATSFSLLFLGFNFLEGLSLSSSRLILLFSSLGAVFYSILLANAVVVCNLALIVSGAEGGGGVMAVLKACVLIRGRSSTALALAVPLNLCLAATEALFHFRIVMPYYRSERPFSVLAFEGVFIAYLYSIVLVLDVVVSCIFYRSCKEAMEVMEDEFPSDLEKLRAIEDFV